MCERCGRLPEVGELFDFCYVCTDDLCPTCFSLGCCDRVPAVSGLVLGQLDDTELENG